LKSIGHYWTYFDQLSALEHFVTRVEASSFGIEISKFKVMLGSKMLENALLALLFGYLENYWTEFHHLSALGQG